MYISYPLKILMKSSKILVIVLFNTLFPTGDKLPWTKYLTCLAMFIGIVIFNMKGGSQKTSDYFGIGLCLLSLLQDGILSNMQDRSKNSFAAKPRVLEMHLGCNMFSFAWGLIYGVITN